MKTSLYLKKGLTQQGRVHLIHYLIFLHKTFSGKLSKRFYTIKMLLLKLKDILMFFVMNVALNSADLVSDGLTAYALCKNNLKPLLQRRHFPIQYEILNILSKILCFRGNSPHLGLHDNSVDVCPLSAALSSHLPRQEKGLERRSEKGIHPLSISHPHHEYISHIQVCRNQV